jgi:hypothetical protein
MAHNLIRKASGKDSLHLRRKTAGWDDDVPASLLAASILHPIALELRGSRW